MENEGQKVYSTKSQLEEFKKDSLIWKDFKRELETLVGNAVMEYRLVGEAYKNDQGVLVTPTTAETLIHLGDIKGREKAVAYFLSIPDILLQILEGEEDGRKRTS